MASYPYGLREVCGGPQPGSWLYTGALENSPDLIDQLAQLRPLLGNRGDVVRRVRDPFVLRAVLSAHGIPFPRIEKSASDLPRDGAWLRKRVRSAGGLQVSVWDEHNPAPTEQAGYYFQERVRGLTCSAVFVAGRGDAVLLGVTQQFVGTAWTGARTFQYAGSVGPLPITDSAQVQLVTIGKALACECGLVGLFGVDAILAGDSAWLIEVNPRYTASVEVLEHALGLQAIALHVARCEGGPLPDIAEPASWSKVGKAVLYARAELRVTNELSARISGDLKDVARTFDPTSLPAVADVPCPDVKLRRGFPVLTLLARGRDCDQVERELQQRAALLESLLYSTSKPSCLEQRTSS